MKCNLFRKLLVSSVLTCGVLGANIVNAQPFPQGVQDVIKLKQAGLSDDVILSQIKNSGATYSLNADQIIQLKQAGLSDEDIKALISGNGTATAPMTPMSVPAAPPSQMGPPPEPNTAAVPAPATPPPGEPAPSFDAFQAQLAPYGNWVEVPGYGLCWQPTVALEDPTWRPYLDAGHWIYTDAGWSWQSDYPWGDIAFHYGRWTRHHGIWVWVPGYDWAPAWVAWREADGYSGWAPLPPAAVYRPGIGLFFGGHLAVDVDFGLGPDDFTFVAYDHFWDHHLRGFYVPHDRAAFFFHHSHEMNGYHMDHGHFVVEGLGHDHMSAVTHHDIRIEHESHGWFDTHGGRDGHDGFRDGNRDGRDGGHDGGRDRHD